MYFLEQENHFHDVQLNEEQLNIFNGILSMVITCSGGKLFIDASGGTGKTFLINYRIEYLTRNLGPVMATASSGIASTLLSDGRTLHSTFNNPAQSY